MANNLGSFDLRFTYPPVDAVSVIVGTNVTGIAPYSTDATATLSLTITSIETGGETRIKCATLLGGAIVDYADFGMASPDVALFNLRVYAWNNQVGIYCNDKLIYTYGLLSCVWQAANVLTLSADGAAITFTNIRVVELADRRDKISVGRSANSDSLIQSIIQQRPVKEFAAVVRQMRFAYNDEQGAITAHTVHNYTTDTKDSSGIASDGIIDAASVTLVTNDIAAADVGFVTRSYQMTDVQGGSAAAVAALQLRAIEQRTKIGFSARFDPRAEVGDQVTISKTASGTLRAISDVGIIEDLSVTFDVKGGTMQVTARRKET